MKVQADPRLFWFLKEDAVLDLEKPSELDLYVQQVLTRGTSEDVTHLLKKVARESFEQSFERIKGFLPGEVRKFWEDFLADYHPRSGSHP